MSVYRLMYNIYLYGYGIVCACVYIPKDQKDLCLTNISMCIFLLYFQLVRDLNRAVATHVALAALLGGSGDGPHLRDELRRARRTAQEAAAAAKATLLPALLE